MPVAKNSISMKLSNTMLTGETSVPSIDRYHVCKQSRSI